MPSKKSNHVESSYTPFAGSAPSVGAGGPGVYDKHPNIGPAGNSGGVPLKFFDESLPGVAPGAPSMNPSPAKGK